MAGFQQSKLQQEVQEIATTKGYKRVRVQDGIEVRRVHYEGPGSFGFYIWEYGDGGCDLDHACACAGKDLPAIREITAQVLGLLNKARAEKRRLIILNSEDERDLSRNAD